MPIAHYSACGIAWRIWEQPVVALCGVVPVAAALPIFPTGTYRHYRGTYIIVADMVLLIEGRYSDLCFGVIGTFHYI